MSDQKTTPPMTEAEMQELDAALAADPAIAASIAEWERTSGPPAQQTTRADTVWDANDPRSLIVDQEGKVVGLEGKSVPQTTPYRRGVPRAEAAIFRAFCAHTGSGGMGGPALTARYALGVLAETAGDDPHQQAEVIRQWACILMTAAEAMEPANAE